MTRDEFSSHTTLHVTTSYVSSRSKRGRQRVSGQWRRPSKQAGSPPLAPRPITRPCPPCLSLFRSFPLSLCRRCHEDPPPRHPLHPCAGVLLFSASYSLPFPFSLFPFPHSSFLKGERATARYTPTTRTKYIDSTSAARFQPRLPLLYMAPSLDWLVCWPC